MSQLQKLFLVPAAVTFGFGTWQMQRKAWKEDLIEKRRKKLYEPHQRINDANSLLSVVGQGDWEYSPVDIRGVWDHEHEMLVGMRSQPLDGLSPVQAAHNETGFHVVTPLVMEDGTRVLVNRGWIPQSKRSQDSRPNTLPDGTVVVEALAKTDQASDSKAYWASDNMWTSIDVPAMSQHSGVALAKTDLFFEQLLQEDLPKGRSLASYETFPVTPTGHLMYSLSIAALVMGRYASRGAVATIRTAPRK